MQPIPRLSSKSPYELRLKALRYELLKRGLDGYIVPIADEHLSEYVGEYAQRLAWLTGFGGSAGTGVVLLDVATMFTDGRYTIQAREQVDSEYWSHQSVPQTSVAEWLGKHVNERASIGYDPWLHSKRWSAGVRAALTKRRASLVPVTSNPVDAVWFDRPPPSAQKLIVHPESLAGVPSAEKRRQVANWLVGKGADVLVLSALDAIAWLFNVRGSDIQHTPVALAYALIHADATADLFIAAEKLTDSVAQHLGVEVRLHPISAFRNGLAGVAHRTAVVDPERNVEGIFDELTAVGATIIEECDPVVLTKAIKNPVEIAGHKLAHVRDGAALCNFLHWLSLEATKGGVTEISAASRLREFRAATGELRDLSFETISAAGPSGAMVHYHATEESCRALAEGMLYLVDSGGQYLDGTTDVTRTVAIGGATREARDRFTRVLKGHIALARAVFPWGTRGEQLDAFARQHLWAVGLDYSHGTGHGVGAYLGVHEGPPRITKLVPAFGVSEAPLTPGMIVSNEPGYYKTNCYGIRIENLMLVVRSDVPDAETDMLGFEVLTLAPIDRSLIDVALLSVEEIEWIDAYHSNVLHLIGPLLQGAARTWLLAATQPLSSVAVQG